MYRQEKINHKEMLCNDKHLIGIRNVPIYVIITHYVIIIYLVNNLYLYICKKCLFKYEISSAQYIIVWLFNNLHTHTHTQLLHVMLKYRATSDGIRMDDCG